MHAGVVGQQDGRERLDEAAEYCIKEGENPVVENLTLLAGSRVGRGT